MSDTVFEIAKSRDGIVNRTSDYAETAKCYEKFRKIHNKTFAPEPLF